MTKIVIIIFDNYSSTLGSITDLEYTTQTQRKLFLKISSQLARRFKTRDAPSQG